MSAVAVEDWLELERGLNDGIPRPTPGGPVYLDNVAFMRAAFAALPEGAVAWTASFQGCPLKATPGMWAGRPVGRGQRLVASPFANNYLCVSSFKPDATGVLRRRKSCFAALHLVLVDDIGPKVAEAAIRLPLSAKVETSPGNCQGWYLIEPPETDRGRAARLIEGLVANNLSADGKDPGMKGVTRYGRLPVGANAKHAYTVELGGPFVQRVVEWHPHRRYSLDQLARAYGVSLEPPPPRQVRVPAHQDGRSTASHGTQSGPSSPERIDALAWLQGLGLYIGPGPEGWHHIVCPWAYEHSDGGETGTAYHEPAPENGGVGGFKCHHGHCEHRNVGDLLRFLEAVAERGMRHA